MEPRLPASEAQSFSHWTTREAPCAEGLKAALDTETLSWSRSGATLHSHSAREGGQGLRTPSLPRPADLCCSRILAMVKRVEQLSLGVFQPSFMPVETVRQGLQDSLPADIHILASQRLGISLTHWPNGENFIVTNFATRDEVIEVSRGQDAGPGSRWVSTISCPVACRRFPEQTLLCGPGEGGGSSRRRTSFCLLTRELSCTEGRPREYGSRTCCSGVGGGPRLYAEGYGWGPGRSQASSVRALPGLLFPEGGVPVTPLLVLQVLFDAAEKHQFPIMCQSPPHVGRQNNPCLLGAPIQTCEGTDSGHRLV